MFDFPANPAIGDKYEPVDGPAYTWNGFAWSAGVDNSALAEYVLRTGDTMSGALLLPISLPTTPLEATHKDYVDKAIASMSLYQGVWQPGPNIPDLTPANVSPLLNGYSWVAATADPAIPEVPPAGIPGLSGASIASSDSVIWNEALATYQIVKPPLAAAAAGTNGDVKSGFQTADHNGWVKLDGRAVTALTPSQQTVAASLGFTTNLPNAANLVMMQTGGAMGVGVGSMNKKITQANIPAYQMTTGGSGGHGHMSQAHMGGNGITFEGAMAWNTWYTGVQLGNTGGAYTAERYLVKDVGDHTHAVGSGGSGADFNVTPASLSVNMFVFLGL